MEIFDKSFVHFMWDDELEGKKVFVADSINTLIECVEKGTTTHTVQYSRNMRMPFERDDFVCFRFRFAYYDPNYEVKKAFNKGKVIQFLNSDSQWEIILSNMEFMSHIEKGRQLRVKPEEEEKWIAYLDRGQDGVDYLVCCRASVWTTSQRADHAKTKLFIGSHNEAVEWIHARKKFTEVIKAWEDGKTIQFYSTTREDWRDVVDNDPFWEVNVEYRVKPECPCEDGIDSKACVGCEHSEDGKKEYRPYESSAEMIADFIDRFKAKCPSYCEPLIWLKRKNDLDKALITNYGETKVLLSDAYRTMEELFNQWTYLDGSPVGMEVKE